MVLLSLDRPLSLTASKIGRNVGNSIIFIFGYLLIGALINVIKSSTLKLTITFAWNAELISHYFLLAVKMTNKLTIINMTHKAVHLNFALAAIIRFKSSIQIRVQRLSASSAMFLRHLLAIKSMSGTSMLRQQTPLSLPRLERLLYDAHPNVDSATTLQINNQKIWSAPALKKLTDTRKTKSTKRIEFSEMLREGEEIEKDRLVST